MVNNRVGMMITTIGPVPYALNSVRAQPRFLDEKLGQALQHSLHGTTDTPQGYYYLQAVLKKVQIIQVR